MEDGPENSALLRAQLAALEEQCLALKRRIKGLEPPAARPSTPISPAEVTAASQAMRLTTHDKPRIVSCASLHRRHVELPRGCLEEMLELLNAHGMRADIDDQRDLGAALTCRFTGTLRTEQQIAVGALVPHDC